MGNGSGVTADLGGASPSPDNQAGIQAVNDLAGAMTDVSTGLKDLLAKLGNKSGTASSADTAAKITNAHGKLAYRIEKLYAVYGTTGKANTSALASLQVDLKRLSTSFRDMGLKLNLGAAGKKFGDMLRAASAQTAAKTGPEAGRSTLDSFEEKLLNQEVMRTWKGRNRRARKEESDRDKIAWEQQKSDAKFQSKQKAYNDQKKKSADKEASSLKGLMDQITHNRINKLAHSRELIFKAIYGEHAAKLSASGRRMSAADLTADNKNLKTKKDNDALQKAKDALLELVKFNRDNKLEHGKETIRKFKKYGFSGDLSAENAALVTAKKTQTAGERLASNLEAIDKLIDYKIKRVIPLTENDLFKARKYGSANAPMVEGMLKYQSDAKQKAAADKVAKRAADTLQNFQQDMIAKSQAGMSVTKSDLKRAIRLNSPDVDSLRLSIQSDADAKAKKKEEAEAARKGKGGTSFFGGFARNTMIGGLYQLTGPVMAPLTKFTTGVMEPALNALKAFGDQAHQQGRGLAYNTGMAEALGGSTYGSRASAGAMLQSNATQEITTAISSKMVAGVNESAGRLADSASSMFTNALVSPLTGFKAIVDQIGGAVGMFNPGIMSRFNIMFRDLTATIGSGLAPVMNLVTDLMRNFGDFLQPVITEALPKFRELMGDLYRTLAPMIPTLVQAIKEMIDQFSGGLKKFAAAGDKGAFVKNALLEATGLPNVNQMVNQTKGAIGGAMIGAAMGSVIPVVGTLVGGLAGGLIGSIAGRNWEGEGGVAEARAKNAEQLKRGNITGMAAATDARFSSGMDIAKQAAQTAFIASSSIGMSPGADIDMELKKQQLKWFKKANEDKQAINAVNGNAQAGVAGGMDMDRGAAEGMAILGGM